MASSLKALSFLLGFQMAGAMVDCGGHFANACTECPDGNGYAWCNGDCVWTTSPFDTTGQCKVKPPMPIVGSLPGLEHFQYWWYYFGFGTSALIMLVFACVYYSQVVKQLPKLPSVFNVVARERGLFACFENRDACLYATFCMPVVAGKNYEATQVMGFWPGCILTFLSTYSPLYLLTVLIRAILSMKVQEKLGHKEGFLKACCLNVFCMPCDVGREGIEVDEELGATITCCCNLQVKPRIVTEASNAASRLCG